MSNEVREANRIWNNAFLVFVEENDKKIAALNEENNILCQKLHKAQMKTDSEWREYMESMKSAMDKIVPEPLGQTYEQLCDKIAKQNDEIKHLQDKLSQAKSDHLDREVTDRMTDAIKAQDKWKSEAGRQENNFLNQVDTTSKLAVACQNSSELSSKLYMDMEREQQKAKGFAHENEILRGIINNHLDEILTMRRKLSRPQNAIRNKERSRNPIRKKKL